MVSFAGMTNETLVQRARYQPRFRSRLASVLVAQARQALNVLPVGCSVLVAVPPVIVSDDDPS